MQRDGIPRRAPPSRAAMRKRSTMKSYVLRTVTVLGVVGAVIGFGGRNRVQAQFQGVVSSANPNNSPLTPPPLPFWRVRNSKVFMIPGAGANGANVAVQIGRDGIAMVDTGSVE